MKKLKERFDKLTPKQKRILVLTSTIIFVLIVISFSYKAKLGNQDNSTIVVEKPKKVTTVNLSDTDEDLALRIGMKNQIAEVEQKKNEEIEKHQIELDNLTRLIEEMQRKDATPNYNPNGSQMYGDLELTGVPPDVTEKEIIPPIIINGGISVQSFAVSKKKEEVKKERTKFINYIPSGTILRATLINGMYAPTLGKGKESPYPALFRTYDLSFLPNGVRKDLAGCFILGEAYGELSDSRVHIRLNKLSCISNDERWVLQKPIKGFVNGEDGKVGIAGTIRANFGKLALTVLLTEFVSAAGDAIKSATQVSNFNALGGVTTLTKQTAQDIALSAAGSGIGESTKMLSKFYLDILKEMSPVIEVYGKRDVDIIIEEGSELLTNDYEWEGVLKDEKANFDDIDTDSY